MRYNKLGLFVFAFGIMAFLGPLMFTWLGFFIWPELNQLMMGDLIGGFLIPTGAVLTVIGGLINGLKNKGAIK
ncbi:MAG TPA: hypothetical protein PK344_03650 [Syntrophorhabdaceae bacterium]|nr:hypothetical protein [Syntrophorhabdaceae bacterium]